MEQIAATQIRSIPAEGLVHLAGDVEIRALQTPQAGCLVQVRINGTIARDQCSAHNLQSAAIAEYNRLVALHPAEVAPVVRLQPAAKGTQTKVSDPAHTLLAVAALNGSVERGGQPGQGTVTQLTSLAKRGYLTLTYQTGRHDLRKVVVGATITRAGRIRLAELTEADREAAERAAAIAHVLAYTAA